MVRAEEVAEKPPPDIEPPAEAVTFTPVTPPVDAFRVTPDAADRVFAPIVKPPTLPLVAVIVPVNEPDVAVMLPVSVTPVAVKLPLELMMQLPAILRVPPVIAEPVTDPEKTAAPVEALIENVAAPPESNPASPAEFITTRAPDDADAPE
jgi:hypothetical protein